LTPEEQAAASATKGALALMQEKTSVIKRPIIEWKDGTVTAGLDEETFSALT
jgi:arsenate reductase-like glutaredoxin family protein